MKKRDSLNFIIRTILGLAILFLIVFVGYILSGVLGYSEIVGTEVELKEALLIVLSNPFANFYNSLTPIIIILAIVVSEFITFLVMLLLKNKAAREIDAENGHTDTAIIDEPENIIPDDIEESEEKHEVQPGDLFRDIFSFEDAEEPEDSNDNDKDLDLYDDPGFSFFVPGTESVEKNKEQHEEDRQQTYHYPILDDLVGEYSKEQIDAISKILKFMPDVTARKIRKMFRPELSAEEIRQYIEVLYE